MKLLALDRAFAFRRTLLSHALDPVLRHVGDQPPLLEVLRERVDLVQAFRERLQALLELGVHAVGGAAALLVGPVPGLG